MAQFKIKLNFTKSIERSCILVCKAVYRALDWKICKSPMLPNSEPECSGESKFLEWAPLQKTTIVQKNGPLVDRLDKRLRCVLDLVHLKKRAPPWNSHYCEALKLPCDSSESRKLLVAGSFAGSSYQKLPTVSSHRIRIRIHSILCKRLRRLPIRHQSLGPPQSAALFRTLLYGALCNSMQMFKNVHSRRSGSEKADRPTRFSRRRV